jgi:hypothetical protein
VIVWMEEFKFDYILFFGHAKEDTPCPLGCPQESGKVRRAG